MQERKNMASEKGKATLKESKGTAANDRVRVPFQLPITKETAKNDLYVFVSVNDYTATIKRGETVMIPKYVADMLEQREKEELDYIMEMAGKENVHLLDL